MVIDYPFKLGINKDKIEITIDLNRIRKYNKIAELDASLMESIDENPTYCVDDFIMNFNIDDRISLSNLKNQISKLTKDSIDQVHINNMIYLTVNINKFEQPVFRDHSNTFSDIRDDVMNMLDLATAINNGEVSEAKMSLYSNLQHLAGISFKTDVICNLLRPILTEGMVRLKKIYNPLFKRVIGKTYDFKNLTNLDLQSLIDDIDDYISSNTSRGFKRYRLDI